MSTNEQSGIENRTPQDEETTSLLIENIDNYWSSGTYDGAQLQKMYDSIVKDKSAACLLYKKIVHGCTGWSLVERKNRAKKKQFDNLKSPYGVACSLYRKNWLRIKGDLRNHGIFNAGYLQLAEPEIHTNKRKTKSNKTIETNKANPEKLLNEVLFLIEKKEGKLASEAAITAIDSYIKNPNCRFGSVLTKMHSVLKSTFEAPVYRCFANLVDDATDWSIADDRPAMGKNNSGWGAIRGKIVSNPHGILDYRCTPVKSPKKKKKLDFSKNQHAERIIQRLDSVDKLLDRRFKSEFINSFSEKDLAVIDSTLTDISEKMAELRNAKHYDKLNLPRY